MLAEAYPETSNPPPYSVWRVPLTHFSPGDLNWPVLWVEGAEPNGEPPTDPSAGSPKDPCRQGGSIISCESQTLGEELPVVGTPFRLVYSSDQVPGRKGAYNLKIPLRGATVPARLTGILLEITVAKNRFWLSLPVDTTGATVSRHFDHGDVTVKDNIAAFTWDGRDASGQVMRGPQTAVVRVGFRYPIIYASSQTPFTKAFAITARPVAVSSGSGGDTVVVPPEGIRAVFTPPPPPCPEDAEMCSGRWYTIWTKPWMTAMGTRDARALSVGGWAVDVLHGFDPERRQLYRGTGGRPVVSPARLDTKTEATGAEVDGSFASIEVGPDGTMYAVGYWSQCKLFRRLKGDIWRHVAGKGGCGYSPDGVATEVTISPGGMSAAPDGSLYFADATNRVRRFVAGRIETVAGTGVYGYGGDQGPATQAMLYYPSDVAVGVDGSVYVADSNRVRRIMPDGMIYTIAGCGYHQPKGTPSECYYQEGGAAVASFVDGRRLAALGDGTLLIRDQCRVLKVDEGGLITRIAGSADPNICGYTGDGGRALDATLNSGGDIAVAYDGTIFLLDSRIRQIDPFGIITTIGGPYCAPEQISFGWPGRLYLSQSWSDGNCYAHKIISIGGNTAWVNQDHVIVPSEDAAQVYEFAANGRHLTTRDALTGALVYSFDYGADGRLLGVKHRFRTDSTGTVRNDLTQVEWSTAGEPVALVAPGGQRTELRLDTNGYLSSVTDPSGAQVSLSYTTDGLLTQLVDARNGVHRFRYDSLGRLTADEDPKTSLDDTPTSAGVAWRTLSRTEESNGYDVTSTTALNLATTYAVRLQGTDLSRTITAPDGLTRDQIFTRAAPA